MKNDGQGNLFFNRNRIKDIPPPFHVNLAGIKVLRI
jgi:hypothetical protein